MSHFDIVVIRRVLDIIFALLQIFNMLFIFHNIYKYVVGLKMKRLMIWLFYIMLLVTTILDIILFVYQLVHPLE